MKTYRIASIPGDGIGKEVVPAGCEVLQALARQHARFAFEFTEFGWGGDWYRRHGTHDAGRRPRCAARHGRHPVRLRRRSGHPRPHHAVGPAPEDLPGIRPIRERAADAHPARHRCAAQALHAGGPRLGDRARELRRRVRRHGRASAPGPPDRGCDRCLDHDARRGDAHPALSRSGWRGRGRAST